MRAGARQLRDGHAGGTRPCWSIRPWWTAAARAPAPVGGPGQDRPAMLLAVLHHAGGGLYGWDVF